MTRINWHASKEDHLLISRIVDRALAEEAKPKVLVARDLLMDLTACHANGCPLRLKELFEARRFDFFHDVYGISRHINRDTGKLEDCFLPRFAQPTSEEAA